MSKAISYNDVKIIDKKAIKIGDPVFDNFISEQGGIELATMISIAGTPGAGKTTLCKKLQKDLGKNDESIFFSLESRKGSVARQTSRISTSGNEKICDVDDFDTWKSFMDYIYKEKPLMVIVDSLQHAATLLSNENGKHKYDNYKNIVKDLYDWKDVTEGIAILIVQLNGKGDVEGPMATIFDVDCPIFLTANSQTNERTMHTEKNRMGPIGKIYYEFVNDDRCFNFITEKDWNSVDNEEMLSVDLLKDVSSFIKSIEKLDKNKFKKINSKIEKISSNDYVDYAIKMLEIYKEI
jgi:predicted ATP-dependent serine protease